MDSHTWDILLERTGYRRRGPRPPSPAVAQRCRPVGRETPRVFLPKTYPVSDTYADGTPQT